MIIGTLEPNFNLMSETIHPPEEKWVSVNDIDICYLDWGGEGEPLLALHGLASSSHWYDLVAPNLQAKYHVIAPDQRGHGKTTQADSGYDWETLASDAIALLDTLNISSASVFGHSWGATVALNVAARFPDRVTHLGLLDGGFSSNPTSMGTWEDFKIRAKPRDVSGTREEFLSRLREQLSFCWNEDVERIVQTMVYEDKSGQINDILRPDNHQQVMRAIWEEPAASVYSKVNCPTILIPARPSRRRANSERALLKQEAVKYAEQTIPNCQVEWILETVHDLGYHKPQELSRVMENFLNPQQSP